MIGPAQSLSNRIAAVLLRAAFGGYVIYMARSFYANPTGYFRSSAQWALDYPWEPLAKLLKQGGFRLRRGGVTVLK
jgi:hypothetical protein